MNDCDFTIHKDIYTFHIFTALKDDVLLAENRHLTPTPSSDGTNGFAVVGCGDMAENGHLTPTPSSDVTEGFAVVGSGDMAEDCASIASDHMEQVTPEQGLRHLLDDIDQDATTQDVSWLHFI
jgi:hypothetical protein